MPIVPSPLTIRLLLQLLSNTRSELSLDALKAQRMAESQAQHIQRAFNKQIQIATLKQGAAKSTARASFASRGIQMGVGSTKDAFVSSEILAKIDKKITQFGLKALQVDAFGLDEMDNKILTSIIDKFNGGPVGITTLATAVSENAETIEEVYEPFLIQQGFIVRTPRGREVTMRAYQHLGRIKNSQGGLF